MMAEKSFLDILSPYDRDQQQPQQPQEPLVDPNILHHQKIMELLGQTSVPNGQENQQSQREEKSDPLLNYLQSYQEAPKQKYQRPEQDDAPEPPQNFANMNTDYGESSNYDSADDERNYPDFRNATGENKAYWANNPSGQHVGPYSKKYGGVKHDKSDTAIFPTVVHGIAAGMDLFANNYSGMTIKNAIKKWSGGNNSEAYSKFMAQKMGMNEDDVITKEMVNNPDFMTRWAKNQSIWEGGDPYRKNNIQNSSIWEDGFRMYAGKTNEKRPTKRNMNEVNVTNFTISEFQSKDGAPMSKEVRRNVEQLMPNLQILRDDIGKEVVINSGHRSKERNAKIKGSAKNSQHIHGRGADLYVPGMSAKELYERIEYLISVGQMEQGGLGLYKNHVHYDNRGVKARW